MNGVEYTKVLVSLEDEVFYNCICELEPYLNNGWVADRVDNDEMINMSWITLKRPVSRDVPDKDAATSESAGIA